MIGMCHFVAPEIGGGAVSHADADVVELVVGKKSSVLSNCVTRGTVALVGTAENFISALHTLINSMLICAKVPSVEWRITSHDCALICGNGPLHLVVCDWASAVGTLKRSDVGRVTCKARHYSSKAVGHLDRVLHRAFRLLFESILATIPELGRVIRDVDDRR